MMASLKLRKALYLSRNSKWKFQNHFFTHEMESDQYNATPRRDRRAAPDGADNRNEHHDTSEAFHSASALHSENEDVSKIAPAAHCHCS